MKITRREVSKNWVYVILSLAIGFLLILAIVSYNGKKHVDRSIQYYSNFINEDSKLKVQNEVNNRLYEIYYDMNIVECKANSDLESSVVSLESAINNLDLSKPDSIEGQENFLQAFDEIANVDISHEFFVLRTNGEVLRSTMEGCISGNNYYDIQDDNGVYFVKEMTTAVDNEEGVFVEYLWSKTENALPTKKKSYCRYLKEYDLIIGAGYYYEDIMAELQEQTIQRLLSYYIDDHSYIFLTTYEGVAKVTQLEDRIGKPYFTDDTSPEWKLHQDIMEIVEWGQGGFVTYEYYDKETDVKLQKMSYVAGIDEWQMYIGMGVYTDDLSIMTDKYIEEFSKNQRREVVTTIVVLLLVALLVYHFIRRGMRLFRGYMEQEEGIYKELFSISYEAIFVLSPTGKILHKNQACINLFGGHLEENIQNGKLTLEPAEEDYYIYNSKAGKKYLSYREELFRFNMDDAIIYYVQDVTDTVLKSQENEQLAMKDVLTGAYNRRALIHDIDVLKNKKREISLTIGIIDIDFFKKVNDTYGHGKGDDVLKLLTNKFNDRLRSVDRFYRYGGEEFIVSFQDTEIRDAKRILEEINIAFSEDVYQMLGEKTTFSGGVVKEIIKGTTDLDVLIHEADKLLYEAKENGRNQINIGQSALDE
jgi:diguanylate cyclase (GGDEF)-like protein